MMGYNMMQYGNNMMGGGFIMIIIAIIIIAIVVFLIYKPMQNNNVKNVQSGDKAIGILNERFARGEMNEDEYNSKKKLLINKE